VAIRSRIERLKGGNQRGEEARSHMPYIPAFVYHPAPGKRLRHSDGAGTTGPQTNGRFVKEKRRCLIQGTIFPPPTFPAGHGQIFCIYMCSWSFNRGFMLRFDGPKVLRRRYLTIVWRIGGPYPTQVKI